DDRPRHRRELAHRPRPGAQHGQHRLRPLSQADHAATRLLVHLLRLPGLFRHIGFSCNRSIRGGRPARPARPALRRQRRWRHRSRHPQRPALPHARRRTQHCVRASHERRGRAALYYAARARPRALVRRRSADRRRGRRPRSDAARRVQAHPMSCRSASTGRAMRAALLALLAALALPVPASAEWSCADATYASEVCPWFREAPWFGEAADGYAVPSVAMRWSSDGYPPGSAAMNWNDGIYVIATLPAAGPRDAAALLVDIAYEPHWQRGEAR